MIIVPDTNIWLKELALNTGLGSAVRFFVKQRSAKIGIPEVVEREVKTHARREIEEAIADAQRAGRELGAWFGQLHEIVLPAPWDVDHLLDNLFSRLGADTVAVPFSFESARASFEKTIARAPPSDRDQQFKDGVIWSDCLKLLGDDDVYLVSQDKAFYRDREYRKGLAENLAAEAAAVTGGKILKIFSSLEELLPAVAVPVAVDRNWLTQAALTRAHSDARAMVVGQGFDFDGDPGLAEISLFATERLDVLYFAYAVQQPCRDTLGGRSGGKLDMAGDGTFRLSPQEMLQVKPKEQQLSFTTGDGKTTRFGHVFGWGEMHGGHRVIAHSARYRIDAETGA